MEGAVDPVRLGLDPSADLLALDRSIAVGHTPAEVTPPRANLGITPSEPLHRYEQQAQGQELPTPAAPSLARRRVRPLPRSSFVGRDDDLQRVVDLLAARRRS